LTPDNSTREGVRFSAAARLALFAAILGVALLRIFLALENPNIHYPDEIYQTVEQAHRLVFGNGIITWEFREGIRNYLYPLILAGIIWLSHGIFHSPESYTLAIQAVMVCLSVVPLWLFSRNYSAFFQVAVILLIPGLWFQLVYFSPKTFTEVFGMHVLMCGLFLLYPKREVGRGVLVVAGLLIGIAGGVRFHYLPAVAAVMVWALIRLPTTQRTSLVSSALMGFTLVGLIDWYTWDYPFQSIILNLQKNLVEDMASNWGVAPWHYYLQKLNHYWGWATAPIAILFILGARRYPLLAIMAGLIVVFHSAIGHKEFRFIYGALYLAILLAAVGIIELNSLIRGRHARMAVSLAVLVGWGLSSAYGGVVLPGWRNMQPALRAYQALSQDTDMCGLGTNIPWYRTGGYYTLHQNVSIYELKEIRSISHPPAFNRMVVAFPGGMTRGDVPDPYPESLTSFNRDVCFDNVCIYKTTSACAHAGPIEYNR